MSNVLHLNNNGKEFLLSLETKGIKLGLQRTQQILTRCGNPESNLKSVQIIGTNGKGSTAATLSSILVASGFKVGLYTSPHLQDLSERIQVNNKPIENQFINLFVNQFKIDIQNLGCTFFETLTAMAAYYFKIQDVDIAIFETGLGGQFDSVTACNASLQLFTKISLDHAHILGNSIADIAFEKACAIHRNSTCFSVRQDNDVIKILKDRSKEKKANLSFDLFQYNSDIKLSLFGNHQIENAMLAITAAKHIDEILDSNIIEGVKNVLWPGRVELLKQNPTIYFDVSHNEDSIIAFCEAIESLGHKGKKTLVISIQKTKIIKNSIPILEKLFSSIIITQINDRMYHPEELSSMFSDQVYINIVKDPKNALVQTMKNINQDELLAIIGSHYWGDYVYKNF